MKISVRDLILIALFAGLTAVGAMIKITLPISAISFTMQTAFCTLASLLLGAKKGMASQLVYLCMGLVGLPVFANGGGPQYIFQPSFGYLVGFVFGAYIIGRIVEISGRFNFAVIFTASLVGLAVIYLFGSVHLYAIMRFNRGLDFTFANALLTGVLPFIPGDTVSAVLTTLVALGVVPALKRALAGR